MYIYIYIYIYANIILLDRTKWNYRRKHTQSDVEKPFAHVFFFFFSENDPEIVGWKPTIGERDSTGDMHLEYFYGICIWVSDPLVYGIFLINMKGKLPEIFFGAWMLGKWEKVAILHWHVGLPEVTPTRLKSPQAATRSPVHETNWGNSGGASLRTSRVHL